MFKVPHQDKEMKMKTEIKPASLKEEKGFFAKAKDMISKVSAKA